jgi:hypothetical protein
MGSVLAHPAANVATTASNSGRLIIFVNSIECFIVFLSDWQSCALVECLCIEIVCAWYDSHGEDTPTILQDRYAVAHSDILRLWSASDSPNLPASVVHVQITRRDVAH